MKASTLIVFALLCGFFCLSLAQLNTLKLEVSSGSNKNWIAVKGNNGAVATSTIEILQKGSSTWVPMTFEGTGINSGWFTYNDWSKSSFGLPLSFRFTGSNGAKIVMNNVVSKFPGTAQIFDSLSQYTAPGVTTAPTKAPSTSGSSGSSSTTTKAPSSTGQSTTTTTTKKPATTTTTTTTKKPTTTTTTTKAPSSGGSGCSAKMKMMVPLYSYPGSTWDTVIASAGIVKTVAIINPNSGPGNGPDSAFKNYMTKMTNAGVEMIGYVHTSYGARSISTVKKEIDIYASEFSNVVGIFLDEAAATQNQLAYYQELHRYIMSMPGFKYNVLNPGAATVAGYANAATQIVAFEDVASKFASSTNPSFASCANKDLFSVITYSASSASAMQSALNTAKSKGYYGWAYVTSGTLNGGTYNSIPSYYAQMASYIANTINA